MAQKGMDRKEIFHKLSFDKCKRDLAYFIFGYCKTADPHTPLNPVKLIPRKKYLEQILDYYLKEDILFIEKSRQIMCTWIFACIALHRAIFFPHQKIVVISKKEADALDFVEKIKHLYEHLPVWMQKLVPTSTILQNQAKGQFAMANKSVIVALPSGSHQIRSHTGSVLLIDEAAFQDDFKETYGVALPALLGGGKIVAFSSAYPGAFQAAVEAKDDIFKKGLSIRRTSNNICVLTVHYSADPDKTPYTEAGKAWLAKAGSAYLGGFNDPLWQREMEGKYAAGGGDFVFPSNFFESGSQIIVPSSFLSPGFLKNCTLFGGFDWGQRNPTGFVVFALSPSKIIYAVWEYYVQGIDPITVAKDIRACPYYDQLEYIAGDPDLWRNKQITSSRQGFTNVAAILMQELPQSFRLNKLIPGEVCKDAVFIEKLRIMWGQDQKRFVISDACPELQKEFRNIRHPKSTFRSSDVEGIIDKDNHLFDATKYALMSHPAVRVQHESNQRGTLAYYEECDALARERVEYENEDYNSAFLDIFEG